MALASASRPAVRTATSDPPRSSNTAPAAAKASWSGLLYIARHRGLLRGDQVIGQRVDRPVNMVIPGLHGDVELVLDADDQHQRIDRIEPESHAKERSIFCDLARFHRQLEPLDEHPLDAVRQLAPQAHEGLCS